MSKKMEQKSLKIKEDDKFFNRLMSKESSLSSSSNTSSRHYYVGASGSVPFMWESQPGTPKHVLFSDNSSLFPPLTPPPSYNSQSKIMNNMKQKPKITCLSNIFLSWKNIKSSSSSSNVSPSSSLSRASLSNSSPTSSRSSPWSSSSVNSKNQHRHRCRRHQCFWSRSGNHVHDYDDNEEEEEEEEEDLDHEGTPNSTLSFGVTNRRKKIYVNGSCRFRNVKSALLCVAGCRSA